MIRSELCLFDLASRKVRVLLRSKRLIEAPNWAPDGESLVVNGDGRLFRIALGRPVLAEIDTDFADQLNNDHGISPDGKTLVMSDSTRTDGSCIYTLPAAGGVPRRVTAGVPSWWHGWSPDGETLAYTAKRAGAFNIFTIPVGGGDERQITSGGGHHDGPDYAPDGGWIWFNSDQGGGMQLWRVRADGSDREKMTGGACANWFAHPSPCGKLVLYLAYPAGTVGHPRDLDVELRLMPASGGAPETLVRIFGGQGSINVPCWHPSGQSFAFMRYMPAA